MNEDLFSILLFAAIMVVIIIKIRGVLGREDLNHSEHKKAAIVPLPENGRRPKNVTPNIKEEDNINNLENVDTATKSHLIKISKKDIEFSVEQFTEGAKAAFEMILKAFANEDIKLLGNLLDKKLLKEYEENIASRLKSKERLQHTLISINKAHIANATLRSDKSTISIDFESEQINIITSEKGKVITGDKAKIEKIEERWTFAKDLSSKDPNWTLIDTDEL